jgi:hypothetical protein
MTISPMELMDEGNCTIQINLDNGDSIERESVRMHYSAGIEQRPKLVMIFREQQQGTTRFERLVAYPDTDSIKYQVSDTIGTIMDTEDAIEYDGGFRDEGNVESIELAD